MQVRFVFHNLKFTAGLVKTKKKCYCMNEQQSIPFTVSLSLSKKNTIYSHIHFCCLYAKLLYKKNNNMVEQFLIFVSIFIYLFLR